jgi:hypothetical protein
VTVTRVLNDPISPSNTISTGQNLYRLSQAATPPQQDAAPPNPDLAYAEQKIIPWKSARCDPPRQDFPRWAGFPVALCDYTDMGVTVRTYMLNADRAKQARWTVTACRDAKVTKMHACIDYMVDVVRAASSGGIFPVAGYVPEPQDGGRCYVFRDGVTVWTTLRPRWQPPENRSSGDTNENEQPLAAVWKYARIASTTREEYTAAGGTMPADGLHWVDVVRALYQKAWTTARNELMSATAIQASRGHRFCAPTVQKARIPLKTSSIIQSSQLLCNIAFSIVSLLFYYCQEQHSARAAASLDPGSSMRLTTRARMTSRQRLPSGPSLRSRPILRAVPSAAST